MTRPGAAPAAVPPHMTDLLTALETLIAWLDDAVTLDATDGRRLACAAWLARQAQSHARALHEEGGRQ